MKKSSGSVYSIKSRIWIPDSSNLHKGPVTNLFIKPRALQPHKYDCICKSEWTALSNLLSSFTISKNVANNQEDNKGFHHCKTTR